MKWLTFGIYFFSATNVKVRSTLSSTLATIGTFGIEIQKSLYIIVAFATHEISLVEAAFAVISKVTSLETPAIVSFPIVLNL